MCLVLNSRKSKVIKSQVSDFQTFRLSDFPTVIFGIDVNCLTLPNKTGVERYVDCLVRAMMTVPLRQGDTVRLYVAKLPTTNYQLPNNWEFRLLPFALPKGWTHLRLSWELFRNPPDVFFNPSHEIPAFVSKKTRIVSTVHDLAFLRVPAAYSPKGGRRQKIAIARGVMKATKLLAISEATKNDLVELAHADATKIVVTPLAVNASDFTVTPEQKSEVLNRYRLSAGKYFLYVGRLETKKNVVTLLRAFAELKKDLGVGHPIELVLAGKWGYGEEAIKQTLAVNNNGVRVLGFTPEEDLASLYSGALAFCFPSLYEGFGMPVLEAAAAGTPVIASDIPALREVMGDAAVFVSPLHVVGWTVAMRRMVFESALRAECVEKGSARVAAFSWGSTANKTMEQLVAAYNLPATTYKLK